MTINERIDKLAFNLELAAADFNGRMAKTEKMLADIVVSIGRLERIAGVLLISDEELDRRLTELEGKAQRKPQ